MKTLRLRELRAGTLGLAALPITSVAALAMVASPLPPANITVFDQKPADGSVTIKYANLPKNGYVVIYRAGADGNPEGEALGSVPLTAGDHRDVKIKLSKAPDAKSTLWAAMYEDADDDKSFNKSKDKPVWSAGLPPVNKFSIE